MGGVANQLRENEAKYGVLGNLGIVKSGKKKDKPMAASQRRMLSARKATPLLQETALSPSKGALPLSEKPTTGAGTSLL